MGGELKPVACVFCGSTDTSIEVYAIQPDDYHGGHVSCTECDAVGSNAISLNGWLRNPEDAKRAAIEAWNRRASPPPPSGSAWGVTDAMIAEGLNNYSEGGCMGLDENERREVVRNILEAGLSALTPSPSYAEGIEAALEDRAFQAANSVDVPEHARLLIKDLWRAFVEREGLAGKPPAEDGWLDISTAPKDHFPVLTWSRHDGQVVAFLDVTWAWWSIPNGDEAMEHPPTHWRPLPTPPNVKVAP